jgi:hypothetical protein
LIAAGTSLATAASVPAVIELDAAVLVLAAELLAEELLADEELLVLPHPTIAAAQNSDTATVSNGLRVLIADPSWSISSRPRPG